MFDSIESCYGFDSSILNQKLKYIQVEVKSNSKINALMNYIDAFNNKS